MEQSTETSRAKLKSPWIWVVIIVGVLILGFLMSLQSLKSPQAPSSDQMDGQTVMSGGSGDDEPCPNGGHKAVMSVSGEQVATCGNPTNGHVTKVSSDSITIEDSSDGSSKTYTITDDTVIAKKGGVRIDVSDISVGENIGVIPNDDDTEVKRIMAELPE